MGKNTQRFFLPLALVCMVLFCGCPVPPPMHTAEHWPAGKYGRGARGRFIFDVAVRCRQDEMAQIIEKIAREAGIPKEINKRLRQYTNSELSDRGVIASEDLVLQYGWHVESKRLPIWGHVIIVWFDGERGASLVQVIRERDEYVDNPQEPLYEFDWIAAIKNESRARGFYLIH